MNGHKTKTYNKSLQWMSLRATTELKRYKLIIVPNNAIDRIRNPVDDFFDHE